MDELIKGLASILTGLGLPGAIIGAMGYWIYHREQLITTIQNARVDEGKEVTRAMFASSEAINRLTDAIKAKSV